MAQRNVVRQIRRATQKRYPAEGPGSSPDSDTIGRDSGRTTPWGGSLQLSSGDGSRRRAPFRLRHGEGRHAEGSVLGRLFLIRTGSAGFPVRPATAYSYRSATIGSTRVARSAGT